MKIRRIRRTHVFAALMVSAVLPACVPAIAGSPPARSETDPPIVLVLPVDSIADDGTLTIRARVLDDSGVDSVVLAVRGGDDPEFREIPMTAATGDEFSATLAPWPTRGQTVAFYVRARDTAGNEPRFSGNPSSPFLVRLPDLESKTDDAAGADVGRAIGGAVVLLLVLGGWLVHRVAVRDQRRAEVIDELRSTRTLRAIVAARPEQDVIAPVTDADDPRRPAEEEFWFTMLDPLRSMSPDDRVRALRNLAGRAHFHPVLGKHFFDANTLQRWYERIGSTAGPAAPAVSVAAASRSTGTRPSQSGATLVELTIVLALLAIGLGLAASYFGSLERPVATAGELVDGILQHTRARAMATTTPHRVRPISATALVVESGPACSTGPWTLDPELQVDLPDGVELASTAWSVCYVSRGSATTNQLITVAHPDDGSQQLQVLLGGAVRWL